MGSRLKMTRFLAACRFLLLIPVVGCLILTAAVVMMGMGRVVTAGAMLLRAGDFSAKASKTMSLAVIEIIDLFLVGTVAHIAAVGLYKLFISNEKIQLPIRLKIDMLQDLENKIIGVIAALAFFNAPERKVEFRRRGLSCELDDIDVANFPTRPSILMLQNLSI